MGSLLIIWPWKHNIYLKNQAGLEVIKNGEKVVQGYEWFIPSPTIETALALLFIIAGVFLVLIIEKASEKK